MVKVFTSKTQKSGEIGEDLAVRFLSEEGYTILDRNYTIKAGEIDIVAKKGGKLYFFEVKSRFVNGIADNRGIVRPEENVTGKKRERFLKTVDVYIASTFRVFPSDVRVQCISVLVDKASMEVSIDILDF